MMRVHCSIALILAIGAIGGCEESLNPPLIRTDPEPSCPSTKVSTRRRAASGNRRPSEPLPEFVEEASAPPRPRPRSISLGFTDDGVLSGGVTRDTPMEPRHPPIPTHSKVGRATSTLPNGGALDRHSVVIGLYSTTMPMAIRGCGECQWAARAVQCAAAGWRLNLRSKRGGKRLCAACAATAASVCWWRDLRTRPRIWHAQFAMFLHNRLTPSESANCPT